MRILALWCPDWPVVAGAAEAGLPAHRPAAVLAGHRVVACSATARAQGVRRGLRRREAQARCPDLAVLRRDPDRDARCFEPVAAVVEELTPGVEVLRPGLIVLGARGPARYFGGEEVVAERLVDHVAGRTRVECQVGVADGVFAAGLAARRAVLVPPGGSALFLAPLPVTELELEPGVEPETAGGSGGSDTGAARAELIGLLRRLGLTTLGAFAGLPSADVASRFDAAAVRAHRLAQGLDERPPSRRQVPHDLVVELPLDPPVNRVDAAAFAARSLSEQLHTALGHAGLACTRLGVQARTTGGEELARTWRCAEPLTPAGTADRVRWQLDGWLSRRRAPESPGSSEQPGGGLTVLRLVPEEVVDAGRLQLGLWGETGVADERAGRALARVQGLLGPEGVLTGVPDGGRGPGERIRLVPWGDERVPTLDATAPWPGALPAPSPATVPPEPVPARVLDAAGRGVRLLARARLSAPPAQVAIGADPAATRPVRAWAGPWPDEGRWWASAGAGRLDPSGAGRRDPPGSAGPACVRVQVVCGATDAAGRETDDEPARETDDESGPDPPDSVALLLVLRADRWAIEGIYN